MGNNRITDNKRIGNSMKNNRIIEKSEKRIVNSMENNRIILSIDNRREGL